MCGAAGEVDVVLLSLPYFAFWAVLLGVLEWRLGAEPSVVAQVGPLRHLFWDR